MHKPISTIPDGFGQRLADERKRLGLSQSELAEIGGIKRLAQSQYERGTSSPTVRYLAAVAEAGINVSTVLFGESSALVTTPSGEQYRIERQAFELVEEQIRQQPEGVLGAEARFALFQLFKTQLTKTKLTHIPAKIFTANAGQIISA